jgi:anti-sigma factor RsiW
MSGEHDDAVLSDLVDGRLDAEQLAEVERHLASCAGCRAVADDLRRLRAEAARLPVQQPPARVWAQIAARLPEATPPAWRRTLARVVGTPGLRLAWGAGATLLAAVVLVLAVVLPQWRGQPARQAAAVARPSAAATTPVHASGSELVQSVESELRMAEQHYENAIAGLEKIANAEQSAIDPQVATTLRRNLAVIDQAIQESRQALQAQPTNELVQESLFEAFRRKVGLLQNTVALIAEMRKGNSDQAAKILGNLNKT